MRGFWHRVFLVYRPFRKPVLVVLLFLTFVQLAGLVTPYIFGKLITLISQGAATSTLVALASITLVAALAQSVLNFYRDRYEIKHLDFEIPNHTSQLTVDKLFELSIGQHRNENSGLTRSVINEGESSLTRLGNNLLYQLLPIALQTLVTVAAMLWLNLTVGLIAAIGSSLFVWWCLDTNKRFAGSIKEFRDEAHKNSKTQSEILRNLSFIQISSQEKRISAEYSERRESWAGLGRNLWSRFLIVGLGRQTLVSVTKFAIIIVGIFEIANGQIEAGTLVTLVMWANFLTGNLGQIMPLHREYLQMRAAVNKYFAILDIEPAVKTVENPVRLESYRGDIAFEHVSFTYPATTYIERGDSKEVEPKEPEKTQPVALKDVSFIIKAGQKVGFVGASGAGKSTLMALLLRAYDPEAGRIVIGGHDLRQLDPRHFREHIGFVEQNVTLFDNTIRYNLLFGLNGQAAKVTEAELEEVAKLARIDTFYPRLTKGFDTLIGENGVKLSGGERQRVGIARALIKGPPILLLDEATSHLDTVNEKLIKDSIDAAAKGRTLIVIAHRLSTVKDMDKLFVIDRGQIVGEGTHRQLLKTCPTYKALVESQELS